MFDNDSPEDRAVLIKRLCEKGLPAFEWGSGGNITHVIVPLAQMGDGGLEINVEDPQLISEIQTTLQDTLCNPHLFISTNSLRTACEVGIMGEDAYGRFVAIKEWEYAPSIEKALSIFETLWHQRKIWLRKWIHGELKEHYSGSR